MPRQKAPRPTDIVLWNPTIPAPLESYEGMSRDYAQSQLSELIFLIWPDAFGKFKDVDDAIEHLEEHYEGLIRKAGHISRKTGEAKLTRKHLKMYADKYWNSIKVRKDAAVHIYNSTYKQAILLQNMHFAKAIESGGDDGDQTLNWVRVSDIAAKIAGAYAPEKIQNIGESETVQVTVNQIIAAKEAALASANLPVIESVPPAELESGTDESQTED